MELIVTHSNTDFDGLAAQLAAHKLYPRAIAVLNYRLRDNVAAFESLYREQLPFVGEDDLPNDSVSRLIVVDMPSAPTLRGLSDARIPTLIIDHHPRDRAPAPHEELLHADVGAVTSLLVERLRVAGVALSQVEATLLLLGIYDDTGSLAFASTRPADLSAAAWLLEQGAQLAAVGEFLRRPLTIAQEQLFYQLQMNAQIEQITGRTVLLAAATVEGDAPQLASLADELLELYRSDVVALAITTGYAGAQIILRASPATLDAGAVARGFGGGGHAAAAAAYVRGHEAAELLPELLAAITRELHPIAANEPADTAHPSDLLHKLTPMVAQRLEQAATLAEQQHNRLFLVGGAVRDLLLERPLIDLDLVVEGDAFALAQAFATATNGRVVSQSSFGTAIVAFDQRDSGLDRPGMIDIAMARTEFYPHPAALPEVSPASLDQDLLRRDFTINTLAIGLNRDDRNTLFDPLGGQHDLAGGLIRVLHDHSFIDDPTRILRGLRLAARLGFVLEAHTASLLREALALDMLRRTSAQRIAAELRLIAAEAQPETVLALLDQVGVLQALHPALGWSAAQTAHVLAARAAAFADAPFEQLLLGVLLAPLDPDVRRALLGHFAPPSEVMRLLHDLELVQHLPQLSAPQLANSALDRLLSGIGAPALRTMQLTLAAPAAARIGLYLDHLRPVATALNGDDLLQLGIKAGPQIGQILRGLRAAKLDGLTPTREDEVAWVVAENRAARTESQR